MALYGARGDDVGYRYHTRGSWSRAPSPTGISLLIRRIRHSVKSGLIDSIGPRVEDPVKLEFFNLSFKVNKCANQDVNKMVIRR